jgi:hypothetical protein
MPGHRSLLPETTMLLEGNRRSLGSPGFPVESCGFGQLRVVLLRRTTYVVTGKNGEVENPGALRRKSG